jgi:hypothetical protein
MFLGVDPALLQSASGHGSVLVFHGYSPRGILSDAGLKAHKDGNIVDDDDDWVSRRNFSSFARRHSGSARVLNLEKLVADHSLHSPSRVGSGCRLAYVIYVIVIA